jgi:transposase
MLSKEAFAVIKALKRRGVYLKDIAAELGVHPKTVSRALKRGKSPERERKPRGSKLDPYKEQVDQLLSEGVWNAQVILREIEAKGYRGKETILRDYIAPKRRLRPSRATVRFETEPGKQLQSDWGEVVTKIGGVLTKVYFIVNTLGYSRRFHFWCANSQDAEHTYEGLIRSLEYFGGVTDEVLVDNQKAAVLEHPHPDQGPVRFNERFVDLAGLYDFTPRACKPYRARTKGKDERMVGYIKHNFFVRYRAFESWAHLNQLAERWLADEADQRVHGTVKEVVAERFAREKPALKTLPARRYDTAYRETRLVDWDGYINVEGNRYSVPGAFVGTPVGIRLTLEGVLHVYAETGCKTQIAEHRLKSPQDGWATEPEHHAWLWENTVQVQQRPLDVYERVAMEIEGGV